MKTVVYKWTHKNNGKCYIGITNNPRRRKNSHVSGSGGAEYFSRAIKKYGIDAFSYEVLASTEDRSNAADLEKRFIKVFESNTSGYNRSEGGEDPPINDHLIGERAPRAKISEKIAMDIILDPIPNGIASEKHNVSVATIAEIRQGSTWKHLDRSSAPPYKSKRRKVCEEEVMSIINDHRPHSDLAKQYGINNVTVQNIRKGNTWKHLDRSHAPDYLSARGRNKYNQTKTG